MAEVSLRLLYNYGRLPVVRYWSGERRLSMIYLDHNNEYNRGSDGLHCKYCGAKLKGYNKKFCGGTNCEKEYNRLFVQFDCWAWFRARVFKRDNGCCQKCGKTIGEPDSGYYVGGYVCDHIIPLFKGGKDWWEDLEMVNFQTLCDDCNKIKTKHDVAKPHVIKQKLGLKTIQYAGFVFEQPDKTIRPLDNWLVVTNGADSSELPKP